MEAKEAFRIGAYEGLIDVLLCLKKQGDAVSIPSIKGLKPSNGFTTVSFKWICMPISNRIRKDNAGIQQGKKGNQLGDGERRDERGRQWGRGE